MIGRPRDKDGWLVPKRGTLSRAVYNLMAIGMGARDTAEALGKPYGTIRVLRNHIKYPDVFAAKQAAYYLPKRPRAPCQPPMTSV